MLSPEETPYPPTSTLTWRKNDSFASEGDWQNPDAKPLFVLSLKPLDVWVVGQQSHLMNGDLIQLAKPLGLRQVLPDEQGVQVFQVGKK